MWVLQQEALPTVCCNAELSECMPLTWAMDSWIGACDQIPGINLLKMCAAGYFTEGNAFRAARAQTKRVLQSHGFLDEYLTASDGPDGPAERLRNFQDLLAAAGLAKDGPAPDAQ